MSWICPKSNYQMRMVPEALVKTSEDEAKKRIEAEEEEEDEPEEEQDDLSKKFDVEKLRMEKEAEIAELVQELEQHKAEINTYTGKVEQL